PWRVLLRTDRWTHGNLDAALGRDLAAHEGEILALPILELANNLEPRMAADYEVALSDVAQFRASRAIGVHANHGVHALFLHQFPIAGQAHVSPVVRRGVKIIGNSAGSEGRLDAGVLLLRQVSSEAKQDAQKFLE